MNEIADPSTLFKAIHSAPGMAHIARSHSRSFSLNIFQRNAEELIAAAQNVRDPEHGLELMAVANKEAGEQAHREINRFIHNFVASAKSLVEHTRNFIKEHYSGTILQHAYNARVKADFSSAPIAQFVEDLRDYMLHKGLPNSGFFFEFDSAAATDFITGVRYRTDMLLEWSRWSPPAKIYIKAAGEYLHIHIFVESYLEKVLQFHAWLEIELQQHHREDLAQLQVMKEDYARLSGKNHLVKISPEPQKSESISSISHKPSPVPTFEFPADIAAVIDKTGKEILNKIRPLSFAGSTTNSFPSERPIDATLTQDTMRETPILWGNDSQGQPVIAFLTSDTETFGLDANVYAELQPLADKILKLDWAKSALSQKFIEETALHWFRASFRAITQQVNFSSALSATSRDMVMSLDMWAPIAYLAIEEPFELGSVKIAPITKAMLDELETKGINSSPRQRDGITALFKDLRSRIQGLAAVVVHAEAEPIRAHEGGMAIAQDVVGLLRFFSPTARDSSKTSSTALLGTTALLRSQGLVLGENYFSFSDGFSSPPFSWHISKENLSALWEAGLAKVSSLIMPSGLSEFAFAVRTSLLLYSTSTTLCHPADRLAYALSSIEGILLKHSMESAEFNVEKRMSLLLSNDKSGREKVAKNVREVYRIRKRHSASVLTEYDMNSFAIFVQSAYIILCTALETLHSFARKTDFIEAIDREKQLHTP
jgi:hypothetical protein